ncbi:lipase maturation factor family protein [Candidatus Methylomicrobium oryzae]|uniref:lipase maturation factor family protein n=1 Tax=Candidatus Methylomicrobium oryzae TaxID=2802053 RepID=UPI0019217714|nr:lipase maturation factor family protein [Methylomicrobium sp. RS1]MBL1262342.1 lipase maturation factor family protein [Methylomicrobium sp. RS1]
MPFPVPRIKHKLNRWLAVGPTDTLVSWLFLRGLAMIYLAAFASLSVQIEGLIGTQGILPIQAKLAESAQLYDSDKYWLFPTLFWLDASDPALKLACYAGIISSLLLLLNILQRPALMLCYLLYLSLTVAGQDFLSFQWDVFLLEAGFLGILLSWGSSLVVFLYRWLIARFMFMGGVVKLASGDPAWASLTALNYHYLTEPLPTPLAYYAYFLPEWFHKLCVAGVFFIELIVPFFVFMPRPFRLFAAGSFIILQAAIILTGNYNFFNLLTILLCLWLLDDKYFSDRLPPRLITAIQTKPPRPGLAAHFFAGTWAALVLIVCAATAWMHHFPGRTPQPLRAAVIATSSFGMINQYGPFGVMTTERHEIIIEGSNDGKVWQAYEFNYKPGDLFRGLRWNIPHQPRLDWQLWFAALEKPRHDTWFPAFMARLQEGSPPVLNLLRTNPFPDHPPAFLRAMLYRYDYAPPQVRAETGQIWRREPVGRYWPPDRTR